MKSARRAAAIAVAIGLSATGYGTAQAAASSTVERPGRSSAAAPAATAAAGEPEPLLGVADLKMGLYATHPLASKAGMAYPPGTTGGAYCHPGKWPDQKNPDYTDADGDGFCPMGQAMTDLEVTKDGRLISTYGEGNANIDSHGVPAGRVAVVPLNLQNGQWETPFMANSEQTDVIRKLANGDLAIPMTDPSDHTTVSGYLTNKGGKWHTVTSAVFFTHVEDLAETANGDIWLFGSVRDAAIVVRGSNGGAKWDLMKQTLESGLYPRYTSGSAVGGKIFTFGQILKPDGNYHGLLPGIKYEGTDWQPSGWPGNDYFQGGTVRANYPGLSFYNGTTTVNFPKVPPVYGPDGRPTYTGFRPMVYSASDGYLYSTSASGLVRTKSVDGPWELVGEFPELGPKMRSLAVYGDRVYFGGEGGKIYRSGLTVTQAIQASKDAHDKAKGAEWLKSFKAKLAVAEGEVSSRLSADKAQDAKKRDATIAALDAVVAKRVAAAKSVAGAAPPPTWSALNSAFAAAGKSVTDAEAQIDATAQARVAYWDESKRVRNGEIEVQNSSLKTTALNLAPSGVRAEGEALLKASTDARMKAVEDAVAAGKASWTAQQGTALKAKLTPVKEANDAAKKAAATVQTLVEAEAKHRSEVAAGEAKRVEDAQVAAYAAFKKYVDGELAASEAYARRNPLPTVAGMKQYGDRMARYARQEVGKAETAARTEAEHADAVTTSERARASTDWPAMVRSALPGTSEIEVAHRDAVVKRVEADRAEQLKQIDADAAARTSAVSAYGEIRKQWWSVQGESATLSNKFFDVWAKHDASRVAEIARVRKDEEARAARLKAGPPPSEAAKAAQRKRLKERIARLKASSRQVHIADDKVAEVTYTSERKRVVELNYAERAQASKAGVNKTAWEKRAADTLYNVRDARLKVIRKQWKARISANRYAQDAASNDLMRFAP